MSSISPEIKENTVQNIELYETGPQALFIPPGHRCQVWSPERKKSFLTQSAILADVAAFELYLDHMVTTPASLAIYVKRADRAVFAVLDHAKDATDVPTNRVTAAFKLDWSSDFAPLAAVLGQEMPQHKFAEWIEEHDYLFHEAATLATLARNFSSVEITTFNININPDNGNTRLEYATKDDEKLTTKIPNDLTTTLAIFEGQDDIEVSVKLRTRKRDGKLVFVLQVLGLPRIVKEEIDKIETRLRLWLSGHKTEGWDKALLVSGSATLSDHTIPESTETLEGLALPVGFGGNVTAAK